MRPDMQHLLVERGHAGTGYTRFQPKGWKARCRSRWDDEHPLESYREPRRQPHFSENLRPLRRYLEAQVGRPWDRVHAEIRAHVDADSAVQYHILQHLCDRLAVQVWRDGSGRLVYAARGGRPCYLDERWGPHLYVCPKTGILRRNLLRKRLPPRQTEDQDVHAIGEDHEHRRIDGIWYEVWWGEVVLPDGGREHRIIRKRQLAHRELRDLDLLPPRPLLPQPARRR